MVKKYEIMNPLFWEPELKGKFYSWHSNIYFCYLCQSELYRFCLSTGEIDRILPRELSLKLRLPSSWKIVYHRDEPILCDGNDVVFNLVTKSILDRLDDFPTPPPYTAPTLQSFLVDDMYVTNSTEFAYDCYSKDHSHCWHFRGSGYLYTEIARWNNAVFWGTAGNGGYFYSLDVYTGEPKVELRTKGTVCIAQNAQYCYLLRRDNKTELVRVSMEDGAIDVICPLDGASSVYSTMAVFGNILYTTTFQQKKGRTNSFLIHAIDLSQYVECGSPWRIIE